MSEEEAKKLTRDLLERHADIVVEAILEFMPPKKLLAMAQEVNIPIPELALAFKKHRTVLHRRFYQKKPWTLPDLKIFLALIKEKKERLAGQADERTTT